MRDNLKSSQTTTLIICWVLSVVILLILCYRRLKCDGIFIILAIIVIIFVLFNITHYNGCGDQIRIIVLISLAIIILLSISFMERSKIAFISILLTTIVCYFICLHVEMRIKDKNIGDFIHIGALLLSIYITIGMCLYAEGMLNYYDAIVCATLLLVSLLLLIHNRSAEALVTLLLSTVLVGFSKVSTKI